MANLNRKWKRWMATGCLHSVYACEEYKRNVRAFKKDWKPDTYIELGDVIDTAALRTGARGTKDESEPIEPDMRAGLDWVKEMRPSIWTMGNHDARPYELISHPSAIVAELARRMVEDMETTAAKLRCQLVRYEHIRKSWAKIGDMYICHGWMYSINALRDHVERRGGNVLMAHLHSPHMYRARNVGGHWGLCVGTGMDPDKPSYSSRRPATLAHGHGIGYGHYSDDKTTAHLIQWNCEHGEREEVQFPL